jgi:hypothetical protein
MTTATRSSPPAPRSSRDRAPAFRGPCRPAQGAGGPARCIQNKIQNIK